ncbi:MAG TPA: hypothetical protein HPQ04_13970 [Rhodospirillaceae bacterium]|nr:hypothetical protein [Rhodospirillaceae bacterium]
MDEQQHLDLAELLCARLCHDLAGPVGAVATGAELLAEDSGDAADALELLGSSAAAASQRLRFFRLALGPAAKPVAARELCDLATGFLSGSATSGGALAVDWRDGGVEPWPGGPAKLLLNLLLVARDCLPRGGRLRVSARQSPAELVEMVAEGANAAPAEAVAGLLRADTAGLGPRGAQGFYTRCLAERQAVPIDISQDAGRVVLTIRENKKL